MKYTYDLTENNIESKISAELRSLLDDLKGAINNTRGLVIKICNQGLKDGLSNEEVRYLIRSSLSRISDRTIRRYLPQETKAKTIPGKKVDIMATSEAHPTSIPGISDKKDMDIKPWPSQLLSTKDN